VPTDNKITVSSNGGGKEENLYKTEYRWSTTLAFDHRQQQTKDSALRTIEMRRLTGGSILHLSTYPSYEIVSQ